MNKTTLLLKDQIKLYPEHILKAIEELAVENYFIGDCEYYLTTSQTVLHNFLFLVVNPNGEFNKAKGLYKGDVITNQSKYRKNLDIIKTGLLNEFEEKDNKWLLKKNTKEPIYQISYELKGSKVNQQVIVLSLPIPKSVLNLLEGKYSKIYTKAQVECLFPSITSNHKSLEEMKELRNKQRGILLKEEDYKKLFVNSLNKRYGTEVDWETFSADEYEEPIGRNMSQEWLNYDHDILEFLGLTSITNSDLV